MNAGPQPFGQGSTPSADSHEKSGSCGLGIDLGGTKCAAGLFRWHDQQILQRIVVPTESDRGGEAILANVIRLVHSLQEEAVSRGAMVKQVGIGIPELVSPRGSILSAATIPWRNWDLSARFVAATGLTAVVEADVRAAALAEARWGAGEGSPYVLYVTVGTGISASYVDRGRPMTGHQGLTGTFASAPTTIPPEKLGCLQTGVPLEMFASGPALARRYRDRDPSFAGTARDVLERAQSDDDVACDIVDSAGYALGAATAQLVNVLDPTLVVLGGGLGLAGGRYRSQLVQGLQDHVWSELHRTIEIRDARWGNDAGWIGAAWAASTT